MVKIPAKMMAWGRSLRGQTPLLFTDKTVNSDIYINMIDDYLLRTATVLFPDGFKFIQDNAPCHKAAKVRIALSLPLYHGQQTRQTSIP